MKKLITYSKLRGRVLNYPFTMTLSEFINEVFENNSKSKAISMIEIEFILKDIIKKLNLEFFDYLEDTSELAEFFIKLKTNEYDVNNLPFEKIKKQEIKNIFNEYNEFLKKNNLADLGDVEKFVLDYVKNSKQKVLADKFEYKKVKFFRSKLEDKIFNELEKEFLEEKVGENNSQIKEIECFDEFDEVKKALKFARELIDKGEEVKIIVCNLDKYFEIFEAMSVNYGVGVYSTKGVTLHKIKGKYKYHPKVKEAEQKAEIIKNKLETLGIEVEKKEILDKLLEERILEKNLIELTEPNQVFVYKDIENLIFVGANLDTFLKTSKKSPFYVKDLYEDTDFFKSELYFERMKNIAKNLYVVYQKDKKSVILENYSKEKITHQLHNIESKKEYLPSVKVKVEKFSASQINTYLNCPRAYFYKYVLYLQPLVDESKEMEAFDKGSIMHKVFELITLHYHKCGVLRENEYYIQKAFKKLKYSKDDIFTEIFKSELNKILDSFKECIKNAKNPKVEKSFYLDENLNIANKDNYFIKGVIDRIDIDKEIKIVDYKSSKESGTNTQKVQEIIELKNVQLPLYFYWAKKKYNKPTTAVLVSFRNDDFKKVEFVKIKECDEPKILRGNSQWVCYNDKYEENLKNVIFEIRKKIEDGFFDVNEEADCEWCEFRKICGGER